MSDIALVSGSPSEPSGTDALLEHVAAYLSAEGHLTSLLRVRALPGQALIRGLADEPALASAVEAVTGADAVVLGSPVHKASYSGLLKVFADLLPMDAFAGTPVLPLLTGGSTAHVLALDFGLKPLAATLGATHVADGRFLLSSHIDKHVDPQTGGPTITDPTTAASLHTALAAFARELSREPARHTAVPHTARSAVPHPTVPIASQEARR